MRIAILLVVALITGCPADDDGDPGSYVGVNDLASAYKDAYCMYAVRCGLFPDAQTCQGAAINTTGLTGALALDANEVAAVLAGRVLYNGGNVKICFDALAAQSCDKSDADGRIPNLACRDILRGTVAGGAPCTIEAECISGNCSTGSTGCVMGSCIGDTPPSYVPAGLDAPCTSVAGCVEGAYCDFMTGTCAALKSPGATCVQNSECGYGLMCVIDQLTAARMCKTPPALDQPCPEYTCRDDGQYCSTTTLTCNQLGVAPAACTSSTQCSPYYPCNVTAGQCTKGPTLGQPCSLSNRCFDAGTYCDGATATCAALKADGMLCSIDAECASANCDPTGLCSMPMTCF